MYLIQFLNKKAEKQCGVVKGNTVTTLKHFNSTYELFHFAESTGKQMEEVIADLLTASTEDYQSLVNEKRILIPLNHPDPYRMWITGTGLTHLGSAASRDAMHLKISGGQESELSDSMKMFKMGVENGKMINNHPASQPEWFYKGNGLTVVNPGDSIPSPSFAMDGGEEPEIAGLYIINKDGVPKRLGFALSNEFSDHKMEKVNYLQLAHSKLRPCSFGPELLIGKLPADIKGRSSIRRNKEVIWEKEFLTGEENMSHNISNLEYHHFKYDLFRQPGDVHVHFLGTSLLSFTDNIETKDGDIFSIEADAFEKPLTNRLKIQ